MPLDLSCEADACCDLWPADGQYMVGNLALDLALCLPGCQFEQLVSFGSPMAAKGDFIAAGLDRISLVTNAGARSSSALAVSSFPMYRHDWTVTLSVSGWPTIKRGPGDAVTLPPLEQQDRASRQLHSIGESMWRAINGRIYRKTFLPSDRGCTSVVLTSLDRLEGGSELFAGQAGWRASLSFVAPASVSRTAAAS